MRLEVRFTAVPVEGMRAFLEPLGYRFDWGPELDGIGFHWRNRTEAVSLYCPRRHAERAQEMETTARPSASTAAFHESSISAATRAQAPNIAEPP